MARRKEFNPHQALRAAVDVFWDSGYEKTSLDDLMNGMGVGRQSLYDTFGNKRSLYLQALDEYRTMTQADTKNLFESGLGVRDCFRAILFGIAGESRAKLERGCMMINANLERARADKALNALIKRNAAEVREIFSTAVRSGQRAGEIPKDKDPMALATFMFSTVHGMRHLGRTSADRAALEQIATVALGALD
jgi:TetR/AcrR family transcriptional regulator, transcriptional repressor for nem operon